MHVYIYTIIYGSISKATVLWCIFCATALQLSDSCHRIISSLYKDPFYFKAEETLLLYSLLKYNEWVDFLFRNSGSYE